MQTVRVLNVLWGRVEGLRGSLSVLERTRGGLRVPGERALLAARAGVRLAFCSAHSFALVLQHIGLLCSSLQFLYFVGLWVPSSSVFGLNDGSLKQGEHSCGNFLGRPEHVCSQYTLRELENIQGCWCPSCVVFQR